MPRVTSPRASRSTLPCSLRDEPRELVRMRFEQRLEPKQHARPLQRRRLRPSRQRSARGLDGGARFVRRGMRHASADGSRWTGSNTGPHAPGVPMMARPST